MAASLDDTARGIKILPRTDPLQLQGGDVPAVASAPRLHSEVHCIMCLFGRLLGAIRHLDIYASIWIMRLYYIALES